MISRLSQFLLLLLCIFAAGIKAQQPVPAGFEELADEQITEVDIFLGGDYLTSSIASFNNEYIQFHDPQSIAATVKNLKAGIPLAAMLAGKLPGNEHAVCHSDYQIDCGHMEPDSVAIIFNRSRLQIWLFLNPAYFAVQSNTGRRFLPESTADVSFISNNNLYFSSLDLSETSFSFANNSFLSIGETRFSLNTTLTDSRGIDFEEVSLKREINGKELAVGLMRPFTGNFRFQDASRMRGLSFSSSLNTRTDLQNSLGTELQLYFPTRSRIEIYRDGVLLGSAYYEAGNQLIDTASLPHGSYYIDIRITDTGGNVRTEEFYYTKSMQLPPRDQSLYFFQAGQYYNRNQSYIVTDRGITERNDSVFVRAGMTRRINDQSSGSMLLAYQDNGLSLETAYYKQDSKQQYQVSATMEQNGTAAGSLAYRFNGEMLGFNFNAVKVFSDKPGKNLGNMRSIISTSMDLFTGPFTYSLFYRKIGNAISYSNDAYGFRMRFNPSSRSTRRINAGFEVSRNNGELLGMLTFTYNLSHGNANTTFSPRLALVNHEYSGMNDQSGSWQTRWGHQQSPLNRTFYTMRADMDSRNSVLARMEKDRGWGGADLSARYILDGGQTEITGRFNTSFITNFKSGQVSNGRNYNSGTMVHVAGDKDIDAEFDIYVNGVVKATVKPDQSAFIPLAAYSTYDFQIQGRGNDLVVLSEERYRHTLYPGNVIALNWRATQIHVVAGQIILPDGEVLGNALVTNAQGLAITDENGYFQAEVDSGEQRLIISKGEMSCEVQIPADEERKKNVQFVGSLVCR